jgi:hypothetical protein
VISQIRESSLELSPFFISNCASRDKLLHVLLKLWVEINPASGVPSENCIHKMKYGQVTIKLSQAF